MSADTSGSGVDPTSHWSTEVAHLRVRALELRPAPDQQKDAVAEAALAACDALLRELAGAYRECDRLRAEVRSEIGAWEQLFDVMPGGCIVTDGGGRIVQANRAAGLMLNVSAKRLEGRQFLVFSEDRGAFSDVLTQLPGTKCLRTSLTLRPRERRPVQMHVTVAPLADPYSGRWLWFLVSAEDPHKPLRRVPRPVATAAPRHADDDQLFGGGNV